MNLHAEISRPFGCLVYNKFFYDGEQVEKEPLTRCTVFAVSSYIGHEPTFNVRIQSNGGVFHYLPVRALVSKEVAEPIHELDLCYYKCYDHSIAVNQFEYLQGPVRAFIKGVSHEGEYRLTVDWYKSNVNMHLIALANGQFAFLPSHKLLFRSDERELPKYRKLRQEWLR